MPLKKSSDVPLVNLTTPVSHAHLFQLIGSTLKPVIPELTATLVQQLVMRREREGETYIGYGAVILHLISERVPQTTVLLVKSQTPLDWTSHYANQIHHVNKFVILAISPHDLDGASFRPVMEELADEASINQLFEME